jgi:hypothetical protein
MSSRTRCNEQIDTKVNTTSLTYREDMGGVFNGAVALMTWCMAPFKAHLAIIRRVYFGVENTQ